MTWTVHVYRRVCRLDISARAEGHFGMHRFEHLTGTEMEAREFFVLFKDNPQVLAVELRGPGGVKDRFDRLMDLLPELEPSAVRTAILEPPRLVP